MRRTIILASLALHAGLVFVFFVAGLWRIERVEAGRISVAIGVPLPPPPAPAGGASPTKVPNIIRKHPPPVITQLEPKTPETKPADTVTTTTTGTGGGSGEGSGEGSGDPTSTGTCTENCGPGDGSGSAAPVVEKPRKTVEMVPPMVLKGMRIAGETQVHPSDVVKTEMLHEGHPHSVSVLKTCVGVGGEVTSVAIVKSSGYAEYDQALVAAVRGWQYKPYEIGGERVPVCGIVTFQYEIK